jgi:hypothetical protein
MMAVIPFISAVMTVSVMTAGTVMARVMYVVMGM